MERRSIANQNHPGLSKRSCTRLLGVNLSTLYVKPKRVKEDAVTLMNEIRQIYVLHPFKGYRRICNDLQDMGYRVNHKRVLRLMRLIGLQAIYPKKNLSKRRQEDGNNDWAQRTVSENSEICS